MYKFIRETITDLSSFFGAVALAVFLICGILVFPVWLAIQLITHFHK